MADISLDGKAAIVTGSGSGLGRVMALALAGAGANVLVADRRETAIDATMAGADANQRARLTACVADVGTEDGRAAIAAGCLDAFGRIDALINNAGIGQDSIREDHAVNPIPPWEPEPEHLQNFFAVHSIAPLRLAAAVLPTMREQCFGRILTVTTSLTTMTRGNMTAYGGAKAASEAYMAGLAMELSEEDGDSGITVNILVPGGAADTPMVPDRPGLDRATLVQPKVMAAPVIWLVSDLSAGVSGRRFIGNDWDPAAPLEEAIESAGAPIGWNG
jgi:3-oxoacyl-[acyl-carrier protein] reductase